MCGQPALQPDRHVAQAQSPRARVEERLRHDADRVGEVDDPGSRRRAPGRLLGDLEDDGDPS